MDRNTVRSLTIREAHRQEVDPWLALRVVMAESNLDPHVSNSPAGAIGPGQLMPGTAKDLGVNPYDVPDNIRGTVAYLKQMQAQFPGDRAKQLAGYNAGPGAVRKYGGVPPYKETQGYVQKILGWLGPRSASAAEPSRAPRNVSQALQSRMPGEAGAAPTPVPAGPRNLSQELMGVLDKTPAAAAVPAPGAGAPGPGTVPPETDLSLERAASGDPLSRTPILVPPPDVPREAMATAQTPRNLSQELLGVLDEAPPSTARVLDSAPADIRDMLPGFEYRDVLPVLPKPADLPAPELAPPLMAEGAGVLSTRGVPTALLETAATTLTPGGWKPIVGAVASGFGELAEQALHGEPLNLGKAGTEAGLSAIPEVAESTTRWLSRTILRNTPGGMQIRFSEGAKRARKMVTDTFQPETRQAVGAAFDTARASHVHMNTELMEQEAKRLTRGKFAELRSEAALLDRNYKTGGRYKDLVDRLRAKNPQLAAAYDIGDLQQLSSGLRQRIEQIGPVEAQTLLGDFRRVVDDTIFTGNAMGPIPAGTTPEMLRQARKDWANLRAAEDMGQMVENAITSSPNLRDNAFNLRRFYDDLRKGRSQATKSVNRALDLNPGARERFDQDIDEMIPLYDSIALPLADIVGWRRSAVVAGLGQMLSALMLDDRFRPLVFQAVTTGRGKLSPNVLATLANAQRRAMIGTGEGPRPEAASLSQGVTTEDGAEATLRNE